MKAPSPKLTILAYDGPMLHAYAAAMRGAGLRPDRVIVVAPKQDIATGKLVGRWFPKAWRPALAAQTHDLRMNFWPRQLKKAQPALVTAVEAALRPRYAFYDRFITDLDRPMQWDGWANEKVIAYVDGIRDPALSDYLTDSELVLFTGGGLVPPDLLNRTPARFLHIHPGFLPHIRGADGLLWSVLVRGRPGRTAFFLAPGLDDGPALEAEELELATIPLPARNRPDLKTLYRALYAYYDPCLRAELAVRVLTNVANEPLQVIPSPTESAGQVYPFMGPALREIALSKIFVPLVH